jgi:fatty acid desaturase
MSTAAHPTGRPLFRERRAAIANTLALLYTMLGWLASFALMGAPEVWLNIIGVLICTHTMVLAAYLIHEAAHQTLFSSHAANARTGELMSFIAGSSYASFERIRHMHIRHHLDRADLACFNLKALMQQHPALRRCLQGLEWAYLPATEALMHLQVVWRPFIDRSQRRYRARAATMLLLRGGLLLLLGVWSAKALLLYVLVLGLTLHVLNLFDAFHHTFEQHFVPADAPVPGGRSAAYEQQNTYSNLVSTRHPWLNLLILNFCYHNAHHQRASMPWYRLPAFHRELYGEQAAGVISLAELLVSWHRNRVRRVYCDDYGRPGFGGRADGFVGAHAVSFLTVV